MRLRGLCLYLIIALTVLAIFAFSALAQAPGSYWWTLLDEEQAALWKDGVQIGNMEIKTQTFYPRLRPGVWGNPVDPPADFPKEWLKKKTRSWRTDGVRGRGGEGKIPDSGLHLRKVGPKKTSSMQRFFEANPTANEVPDYDQMPAITFVSFEREKALAALDVFQTSDELKPWRQKYGPRAKAYSYDDFQHTGGAFKLEEDKEFRESGFVALLSGPPDENDKATVRSIYRFDGEEEFARALRDADPEYDPNRSGVGESEWDSFKTGIAVGTISLIVGTVLLLRAAL